MTPVADPRDPTPYDACLLVSFGGPEGPEEVLPFLHEVTAGRQVPPARLAEVAGHYHRFGGRSPINDQCRALLAALERDFAAHGIALPLYWGNRHWRPRLRQTLARMAADGVRRAVCVLTSAYPSYSGCRQYRESLAAARAAVGPDAPELDRVAHLFDRPGFAAPFVDGAVAALDGMAPGTRLVFVTHSIPLAMDAASGPAGGAYRRHHEAVAAAVAAEVGARRGVAVPWELAFCSRSGPPSQPWLEPDVNAALAGLHARGAPGAVLVPIGFVSDHMEVVFDLDTEAAQTAAKLGLPLRRVPTPGVDPRFVGALRDLVLERAAQARGEPVASEGLPGRFGACCPASCCRNPRGPVPATAGADRPRPVAGEDGDARR